jgi:hypothetical protein
MTPDRKRNMQIAQDIFSDAFKKACDEILKKTGAMELQIDLRGAFTKNGGGVLAGIGLVYPKPESELGNPKQVVDDALNDIKEKNQ